MCFSGKSAFRQRRPVPKIKMSAFVYVDLRLNQWYRDAIIKELLTCIIHESFGFVNKHPQQIENLCCGFRQGASRPLKVSPERRPVKAGVEARRADYS